MKLLKLLMLCLVGALWTTGASAQQQAANATINILSLNSGQASVGGNGIIQVTVGNTGPNPILGFRVRAQVSVPAAIASVLANGQQTGLPAGWTITANTGSAITVCNGSDVIPAGVQRQVYIKIQGTAAGGPSTVNGQLIFSNGTSCAVPGSLTGDNSADNTSTTSLQVIANPGCTLSSVSASAGTIACNGGTTTITATATGAAGAVEYSLNGGTFQSSNIFTASAGNNLVIAREVANPTCLQSTNVTITQPAGITASASAGTILCNGGTATLTVTASGGAAPLQYSLNGGALQSSNTFNVVAGTYTATVQDANGCTTTTNSVTVDPGPAAIVAGASVTTPIAVAGGTGTITVTASGGTGAKTYVIASGTTINTTGAASGIFTDLLAGTYTFTVTDANSCSVTTAPVTLVNPAPTCNLSVTAAAGTILCNGGTTTLTATASGAAGTVEYSLNGGAFQSGNTFAVGAGSYTVTAREVSNTSCTATSNSVTVAAAPPAITASASAGPAIICNGGTTTLTVTASGGTGSLQYSLNGGALQSSNVFTVGAGTYTVTVQDANGCTATSNTVTISQPSPIIASASVTSPISVPGGTGTISVSAIGGTGTKGYVIATGTTVNTTGATSGVFTDLLAGTYTFTVTDANNCSVTTAPVTLSNPTPGNANATINILTLNGGQVNQGNTVDIQVTIGNTGPSFIGQFKVRAQISVPSAIVTILPNAQQTGLPAGWTITTNTSGAITICNGTDVIAAGAQRQVLIKVQGTAPGGPSTVNGQLLFSNGSSCSVPGSLAGDNTADNTSTSSIQVISNCNLSVTASAGTILCNGGTTTLTATASGAAGAVEYSLNGGAFQSGNTFTVGAGTYTVTARESANTSCTAASNSVTVTQPIAITASAAAGTIQCNGGTTTLTVTASGGTAPLQYSLNGGAFQAGNTFAVGAGTYTVTVKDANNCTATTNTVTVAAAPPAITASASAGPAIACNGGTTTLTVTASGGTGSLQYSLNGGALQSSNVFTVGAGTYTVTVQDANGCTATSNTVTISQPSPIIASASVTSPISVPGGTGTISVSAIGGTGTKGYVIATGTTVNTTGATSGVFTDLLAGTYTFTVTDANNCSVTTAPVTLSNPTPGNANATINILTLNGGQVNQGNTVDIQVTIGNTGPSFIGQFKVRAQISVPTAIATILPNAQQTGLPAGWTITTNTSGAITICNGTDVIAAGTQRQILIKVQGTAPGGPSTVNGQLLFSNGSSCSVPGSLAGDNTADNTSTSSIQVISNCNLSVTASAGTILCNGGTTTLTATASGAAGAVEYSLNGGAFQASNTFTVGAGTYTVTAREAANTSCTAASNSVTVIQPSAITASASAAASVTCNGTTTLTVTASGGTGALEYSLNGGAFQSGNTFTVGAGTYTVTVRDANACTKTTNTVTVTTAADNINPTITAPSNVTVCTNSGCTATGVVLGTPVTADNCTVASVTNNAPAAFPLGATTVTWTVTDGSGNSATATQTVTVNDCTAPAIYVNQSGLLPRVTGPTSSASPYLLPVKPGVKFTSILTVPDVVGGYAMAGIPDGLGAFDNNNGTFTLLMNHELVSGGAVRAHGANGAFVSKWIINKSTLQVVSGSDLMQQVYDWNTGTQSSNASANATPVPFSRFCSADLAPVSAFYNAATGLGTQARIYMNGEENAPNGRQMGTVASGPNAGKAYELGKFNLSTNGSGLTGIANSENTLANPFAQNKTIVISNSDGGTGIQTNAVGVYVGTKTNTGSEVDKAGLTNGTLSFINVTGNPVEIVSATTRATNIVSGTPFTLSGTSSTTFSRPEDGSWNPANPSQFFFVTTDQLDQVADGIGAQVGRSRLWRLNFTDITNPALGGTIDLLLDPANPGTPQYNMFDNMTVDKFGHILLQEDVGNAPHNGKIWQYTIATGALVQLAKHDPARFGDRVGAVTTPATAPFNADEESSGIIDVSDILGNGMFLTSDQAHYALPSPAIEGGQLLLMFNPESVGATGTAQDTVRACSGTGVNLGTPATSDNCSVASVTNDAPSTFPAGTTTVTWTVTDGSGNTATATQVVIVTAQAAPTVGTITQPTCTVSTGSVVLSGLPSGNWTITRNPGGATTTGTGASTTISGLAPGTYTFTVTNAAGCTSAASADVVINNVPGAPAAPTVSVTQPTCTIATGTIIITSDTTGLTFSLDGGAYASYPLGGYPVAAGSHTLTAKNAAGCISPVTNAIVNAQPATPAAPTAGPITHPTCTVATGSVILTGLPSGNWTITRSPGGVTTTGTGSSTTISGLAPGTYTFTVTNDAGCTSSASADVVINAQPATPAAPTVNVVQPTCTVATGTITITSSTAGLTFSLDGGAYAAYPASGYTVAAGSHTLTAKNADGCISSVTNVTVNATPATPAAPTVSVVQPTCTVATGTITITSSTAGLTFSLDGGAYAAYPAGGYIVAAGSHTLTAQNASGCISAVTNVTVNAQPATPSAPTAGTITQPTCAMPSGSVVLNDLPSGNWTITRSPGGVTTTGTGASTTISGLAPGTYTFTVTNAAGCTSPASADVVINNVPGAPAAPTVSVAQPTCTVPNGTITITSATSGLTFSLDGGAYAAYPAAGYVVAAGSHTLTAQNASGCISAVTTATVNAQPATPAAPTVSVVQPTCTVATGTITITSSTAGLTFSLDGGAYAAYPAGGYVVAAGSHTLTAQNASGCISAVTTATVNAQPATPAAPTVNVVQPTCTVATGTITVTSSTVGLTFSLDGGAFAAYPASGYTVAAGSHTFRAQNASGCISAVTNVTVNAQPATPAAPTVSVVQPTCTVPTGTITVTSSTSGLTFSLDGGAYAAYPAAGYVVASGSHTLTAQNAGGCISAVTNVTVNAQPAAPSAPTAGAITQPTCTVATGSVVLSGLPSGNWTITRSPGGATTTGTGASTTISGLAAGTYTFTVTNAAGCTSSASANVVINAQPAVPSAPTAGTITQPSACVATGSVVLNGLPSGNWTITRNPGGATTTGTGASTTISGLAPGTYTFTVMSAGGCTSPASANVVINAQPAPLAVTTTTTAASGGNNGTATANASGGTSPYTYSWNTVPIQTTQTATGLAAGTYTVTVTDARGCTATATATITSGCGVIANAGPDQTICPGGSTTLTASATGGSTSTPPGPQVFTELPTSVSDTRLFSGNIDYIAIGNTFSQNEAGQSCLNGNCGQNPTASKTLTLPAGAVIKKAYLYWSGSGSVDNTVILNGSTITADNTKTDNISGVGSFFGARADVTSKVTGSGNYTVSGLTWSNASSYCQWNGAYGAWGMVVVYEMSSLPAARIHINTEKFDMTYPSGTYSSTINGISVPAGCSPNAKLTIIAFEGDNYKNEKYRIAGVLDADPNNFRGQAGPNLDIITKNAPSIAGGTTSLTYSIESYSQIYCAGNAIEALFDYVKVLKYNSCPTGGCNDYKYEWKKGNTVVGTTKTITVNTAGTYTVKVTDCGNCSATDDVVVSLSTLAATSTVGAPINCNGGTTTVTVAATGGTAPYTGTGVFTKGAGTWSFTVKDAKGCSVITTVTIAQPSQLTATAAAPQIPCGGTTTTITVTANGGTAPYQYSLSGGAYQSGNTFTKGNDTYTFTVKDARGCTSTCAVTVTTASCGPVDPNKCYKLIARHSGKAATVANNSTSNGGNVEQRSYNGGSNQVWKFVQVQTGYYEIINVNSGKVLDVTGGSTANGANIQQWTYGGGDNQKWSLTANGSYFVIKAKHSGKAMSVEGSSNSNGANVEQRGNGNNYNEQWSIVEVSCPQYNTRGKEKDIEEEEDLQAELSVTVSPNPSVSYFNLIVKSNDNNTPVSVKVLDANGKVMSVHPNIAVNSTLRIGSDKWTGGMYFAEVTQGDKRKVVKLIRAN